MSLSGSGIGAYQSVVDRSVGLLNTAAGSDRTLATHMKTAAAVTQAGAARLDHIAAQTREISRAAAGAKTPADERVILAALRSQLAQTSQVVQSTQHKAAELAGHVRALPYPKDTPQPPGHDGRSNGIQAVDNEIKDAPGGPFPDDKKPWEYNLDLKSGVTTHEPGMPGPPVSAGSVTSVDEVWNELHRCFNCNFPIGGAPKEFPKVGDKLPLEIRTFGGFSAVNLPVQVTQVQRTADEINIEFATLPGHADGVGSTIHFRFANDGGEMHLHIRGYVGEAGPGSEGLPWSPLERAGYGAFVAPTTWQPYIDNVTRHVAAGKHMPTWDAPR